MARSIAFFVTQQLDSTINPKIWSDASALLISRAMGPFAWMFVEMDTWWMIPKATVMTTIPSEEMAVLKTVWLKHLIVAKMVARKQLQYAILLAVKFSYHYTKSTNLITWIKVYLSLKSSLQFRYSRGWILANIYKLLVILAIHLTRLLMIQAS